MIQIKSHTSKEKGMYLLVNCYSIHIFIYMDYTQLITANKYVFSFNISVFVNLSDYRGCKIRKCA